jgi:hypothetical protein
VSGAGESTGRQKGREKMKILNKENYFSALKKFKLLRPMKRNFTSIGYIFTVRNFSAIMITSPGRHIIKLRH